MNTTKERPILFSGPMVRAILPGAKTQTRRIVKLPAKTKWYEELGGEAEGWFTDGVGWWHLEELRCPYGKPGERLWVRETCKATTSDEGIDCIHYTADDHCRAITASEIEPWRKMRSYTGGIAKQVPSIHMPRWASRITLEVVSVRVERLQDISDADAIAEGVSPVIHFSQIDTFLRKTTAKQGFCNLWQSINGPDSWAANPWVWVVEFRRCDQ